MVGSGYNFGGGFTLRVSKLNLDLSKLNLDLSKRVFSMEIGDPDPLQSLEEGLVGAATLKSFQISI